MAQYIIPERKVEILSLIKAGKLSIAEAAKTLLITEDTIKRWIRIQSRSGRGPTTELQRLRRERQELKAIIQELKRRQGKTPVATRQFSVVKKPSAIVGKRINSSRNPR